MRKRMINNAIARKLALLLLPVFAALFGGCEDKIQVDLKSSEPRLVIEGFLSRSLGNSFFRLSRTTDFYQPSEMAAVSGALIAVSDSSGHASTMIESPRSPGRYENPLVYGLPQRSYRATVTVDGKTYTASATMPSPILIDSVRMRFQEGDGLGPEADRGYRVHVYFRDHPGAPDYARIRLWIGERSYPEFYLYDGKFSDGNAVDYSYFMRVFQVDDTVGVQLISLDRTMYNYFLTLSEVVVEAEEGQFSDATPANPNTNWSGGALGYFGAFYRDWQSLVVKE